jgi:hypothetical protein
MYGVPGSAGSPGTSSIGNPGNLPNTTVYNDVAINPLTTYSLTVPDGGYITIRWYAQ